MKARITEIVDEASGIKSFRLQATMSYSPGQWMYVKLSEELKHHFTISSSPTEPFLQFTTVFREQSDYKKALWAKKIENEVEIVGPNGGFILDESDKTPRLFVAGGIGITPFRSMIKYAADRNLSLPITLFYSIKNLSEGAFISELSDFCNLRIIETEKEGRLDEEKIKRLCPDWQSRSWWLCGPPAFVKAFMELGGKMGMAPEKLRSEEFAGY